VVLTIAVMIEMFLPDMILPKNYMIIDENGDDSQLG